jgi:hypothetical protein
MDDEKYEGIALRPLGTSSLSLLGRVSPCRAGGVGRPWYMHRVAEGAQRWGSGGAMTM